METNRVSVDSQSIQIKRAKSSRQQAGKTTCHFPCRAASSKQLLDIILRHSWITCGYVFGRDQFLCPNQAFVRFLLAMTVVYGHFMFELSNLGNVAVFGFYTLSGFLITSGMRRSYNDGVSGFLRFWQNRFWRLYPTYALIATLAIIGIALAPEAFSTARYAMTMPSSIDEWLPQITIVGLLGLEQKTDAVRLLPPAWSLGIEIVYYFLISALIARGRVIVAISALLAAVSFAYMAATDGYSGVYLTYHGPAIAFMLGSLSSYAKEHISRSGDRERMLHLNRIAFVLLLLVLLGRELLIWTRFLPDSHRALFDMLFSEQANIVFLLLGSAAIAFFCLTEVRHAERSKTAAFLGDLSYPVFLIHWPALGASYALLHWTFGDGVLAIVTSPAITAEFATTFLGSRLVAVILALGLSALIVIYLEHMLVPLRNRVRSKTSKAVVAQPEAIGAPALSAPSLSPASLSSPSLSAKTP